MLTGGASNRLAPEQRLIVACIRSVFGGQDCGAEIQAHLAAPLDWDQVLRLAFRQGVAPLVQAGLRPYAAMVPNAARGALVLGYAAAERRVQAQVGPALRRALHVLGDADLEPIVLKGAAFAHLVYPEPAYRTLADIDLLLPADGLTPARAALLAAGFQPEPRDEPWPHGHRHLPPLLDPTGQVEVELHHHVVDDDSPYALDPAPLWARSERHDIAGVQARVLAPPDALLHVCVHLAYDHCYQWFPLRSLTDVLAIATRGGADLDWDQFVATVRDSGTTGAVYWPLWMSQQWLGAPIPRPVLAQLAPPGLVRSLVESVAEPGYVLDTTEPTERGSRAVYTALLDLSRYAGYSRRQQVSFALRVAFPPPEDVGLGVQGVWSRRLRYYAYVLRPGRAKRGLLALARLATRTARLARQPEPAYQADARPSG